MKEIMKIGDLCQFHIAGFLKIEPSVPIVWICRPWAPPRVVTTPDFPGKWYGARIELCLVVNVNLRARVGLSGVRQSADMCAGNPSPRGCQTMDPW